MECSVSLEDWSEDDNDDDDIDNEEKLDEEDEEIFNIRRHTFPHSRPERDFISEIPHEETEVGGLTMVKLHGDDLDPLEMNIVPRDNWMDSCDITGHEGMNNTNKSDTADLGTCTPSQNSCDERSHVSSSPSFRNAPQSHIHPHIPKLTLHDEASNHGIADETYAKLSGTYSLRLRHSPRTHPPVRVAEEEKEPVPALRSFNSENGLPAGPQERHHQGPISTLQQTDSTPQMDHSSSNSSAKPTAKDFTSGHRRHHRPPKISQTDLKDVR